ncbi:MAG: hypothetical protein ABR587_03345 [Candidatus Binatia bacterium]
MTSDERNLIEKLRRIEALFSRPGTEGERDAASRARDRILERLRQTTPHASNHTSAPEEPAIEYRFSLADPWSQRLLHALLRHHGIATYRRRGQRRNTITARVTRRFVDEVLWPQFREFERELREYFDRCTERIIAQALGAATNARGSASR